MAWLSVPECGPEAFDLPHLLQADLAKRDCTLVFSGTKRGKLLERLKAYLQQEDVDDNNRRTVQRLRSSRLLLQGGARCPRTRDTSSTSWFGRRTRFVCVGCKGIWLREDQATGFCKGIGSRRKRHEDVSALRDCAKRDGATGKTARRFLDFLGVAHQSSTELEEEARETLAAQLRGPHRQGMKGPPPPLAAERRMRIAALNVGTLTGRVQAVADLAAYCKVRCLCLQETRLAEDSYTATRNAFLHLGWSLFLGPQGLTTSARVAIITDWPCQRLQLPLELEFEHRVMAVKLSRPGQRPLLLLNVYLPAADFALGTRVMEELMEWAATTGEEWVIFGDYNREQLQYPISHYLAAGLACACDPPHATIGTRRDEEGNQERRRIDYAL